MAITRSTWLDDDGSGTTGTIINNAELQKIYTNIDAMLTTGSWTPVDASGAGLVLSPAYPNRFWRTDKLVVIQGAVTYPATANALQAKIGGLPVANGSGIGGLYVVYAGIQAFVRIAPNVTVLDLWTPNGAPRTNAEYSSANLYFSGVYLTA